MRLTLTLNVNWLIYSSFVSTKTTLLPLLAVTAAAAATTVAPTTTAITATAMSINRKLQCGIQYL